MLLAHYTLGTYQNVKFRKKSMVLLTLLNANIELY